MIFVLLCFLAVFKLKTRIRSKGKAHGALNEGVVEKCNLVSL